MSYEKGLSSNLTVTYWMNSLQNLNTKQSIFVSLNPVFRPEKEKYIENFPMIIQYLILSNSGTKKIWSLQGSRRTWFCGSYHGFGFHEDGLQSGLAVAEKLSGLKRPWSIPEESNRIAIDNNQVCDL